MHYTLVDKNLLIPEISVSDQYFEIITQLYKKTYLRNKEYCSNVYVVKYNGVKYEYIICFDGETFYELVNGERKNLDLDLSYIFVTNSKNDLISNTKSMNTPIYTSNKKSKDPMSLSFNNELSDLRVGVLSNSECKIEKEIDIKEIECKSFTSLDRGINTENSISNKELTEENKKDIEKEKKKKELAKICEEVMDLYNLEMNNIKKTEFRIKSLDAKLEKLEKKKREKIILDISRTKGDYDTWKKIKYQIDKEHLEDILKPESELELRENPVTPILFEAKYNYIENAIKHEKIKRIFDILNKINIDELYISESIDLDQEIINFCDKYYQLSKKDLHYNFDHDWDYLDTEMNSGSKSGSLSMFN